jgi:hypothetical protein
MRSWLSQFAEIDRVKLVINSVGMDYRLEEEI